MRKSTSSRLRHLLTLQQEVQTPDGGGGYTRGWQDVASLWAEIIPLTDTQNSSHGSGREVLFAGQVQAEISHRIRLRYRDGVTARMRLVFENRAFNIRAVADTSENRDTMDVLAQEGAAS